MTTYVSSSICIQDRHTTAHAPPELDSSQDWFLIEGKENEFGTILKFVRKLDTCDKDDLPITVIIFSRTLFIYLFIYLFVYLFIYLFIYLF